MPSNALEYPQGDTFAVPVLFSFWLNMADGGVCHYPHRRLLIGHYDETGRIRDILESQEVDVAAAVAKAQEPGAKCEPAPLPAEAQENLAKMRKLMDDFVFYNAQDNAVGHEVAFEEVAVMDGVEMPFKVIVDMLHAIGNPRLYVSIQHVSYLGPRDAVMENAYKVVFEEGKCKGKVISGRYVIVHLTFNEDMKLAVAARRIGFGSFFDELMACLPDAGDAESAAPAASSHSEL